MDNPSFSDQRGGLTVHSHTAERVRPSVTLPRKHSRDDAVDCRFWGNDALESMKITANAILSPQPCGVVNARLVLLFRQAIRAVECLGSLWAPSLTQAPLGTLADVLLMNRISCTYTLTHFSRFPPSL